MLVCDVSAVDRLIDMYGENLSVIYKDQKFSLYNLRYEFVDNNIQCSLDDFKVSPSGIYNNEDVIIISLDPIQNNNRDDVSL